MLGNEKTGQDLLINLKEAGIRKHLTEESALELCLNRWGACEVGGSAFWQREECEEFGELQQTESDPVGMLPGAPLPELETPSYPPSSQGPRWPHRAFTVPSRHPPTHFHNCCIRFLGRPEQGTISWKA